MLTSPLEALQLITTLGASAWLVRHHELVVEAATMLCDGLERDVALPFDRLEVLMGAALHDAGKILHPSEMQAAGHQHEAAGRQLLVERDVPDRFARFCVTHASWEDADRTTEDLLVALADKLWKGKRVESLEERLVQHMATELRRPPWEVFELVDRICEAIAADAPARLARSVV